LEVLVGLTAGSAVVVTDSAVVASGVITAIVAVTLITT
jgi:hypothetical protein